MSVSKLCEELVKVGQSIEVLTTTANGEKELNVNPNEKQLVNGVPVTYFKRVTKDHTHFSPALLTKLYKEINNRKEIRIQESHNPQPTTHNFIIHIHAWWNFVSVLSCLIAVLTKSVILLSPRGTLSSYSFGNRNGILKKLFHFLIGKPLLEKCHFHVTSEKEKAAMLILCNPKSITVIANFVRFPIEDHKSIKEESDPINLIFMSRIEEKKGLPTLFESLSCLEIPYFLTIAGNGEKKYVEQLKQLCIDLNISQNINWIGHIADDKKFKLLSEHDLFVLPSHDENFANVVIESLSVGTAVLLSENVGLADYVTENEFGWTCVNQPAEYKQHLEYCYKNKPILQNIRKKAPKKIREDFSDSALITKYIDMYNKVLTSH
ncbi:MAG: hypothetical protein JWN56_1439 [Sphingobacteriales bacterium]|nr:hypothetical protein [Sphingobacteriales bacterium]